MLEDCNKMSLKNIKKLQVYKDIPRHYKKSSLTKETLCDLIQIIEKNNTTNTIKTEKKSKYLNKQSPHISDRCDKGIDCTEKELLEVLKSSIESYLKYGERSNQKLKILHSYIACAIYKKIKEKGNISHITIKSLPGREDRIPGIFYDKNVDISIRYKRKVYGIASVKFVMSNYQQNENNYFESLIGECMNLKAQHPERHFWYILFTFDKIPYFNKSHKITRFDNFKTSKYEKLRNADTLNLPDDISITLININPNKMKHPKTLHSNSNLHDYVTEVVRNNTFDTQPNGFDFFKHLDHFCDKIISSIEKEI